MSSAVWWALYVAALLMFSHALAGVYVWIWKWVRIWRGVRTEWQAADA